LSSGYKQGDTQKSSTKRLWVLPLGALKGDKSSANRVKNHRGTIPTGKQSDDGSRDDDRGTFARPIVGGRQKQKSKTNGQTKESESDLIK